MPKLDNIELRSEEVRDILTSVPHWMIRWGNIIIFIIVLIAIVFSWLIKYPEIIRTSIIITTDYPPQKIVSKTSGKIEQIFVRDKQYVDKGTVLANIENAGNFENILFLKEILDNVNFNQTDIFFPIDKIGHLELGEIENSYANFEKNYINYQINIDLKPYLVDKKANSEEKFQQEQRLSLIIKQEEIAKEGLDIRKKDLERHIRLYEKGAISKQEVETKQVELLQQEKDVNSLQSQITSIRSSLIDLTKVTKSTELNETKDILILRRNLLLAYNQLNQSIIDWELKYLFKSTISGRITFLQIWKENQTIEVGENVFVVIPEVTPTIKYIGKVKATLVNSGKIKKNQEVNIRLDNYPDREYGFIKGVVKSVALIPDKDNNLLVDIELPQGMMTTYKKELIFQQEMSGKADIITEDLRLIQRLLYQFRDIFKR
jgi:multidrug resistance efflux pump